MLSSKVDPCGPETPQDSRLGRFAQWTLRHRTLFWTLHSVWALLTGAVVVFLAHENYAFVPWLFAMLGLTWVSTFFFCWTGGAVPSSPLARIGGEFVSYLTRVLYQETLFFLLPFYAYSTTLWPVPEWHALFLALLAILAIVSCFDLVFDRLIRESTLFGLSFFTLVAFATLNFLLPVVLSVGVEPSATWAGGIAAASAMPLSLSQTTRSGRDRVVACAVAFSLGLGLTASATWLVPPAPLRAREIVFARAVVADPLEVRGTLEAVEVSQGTLQDQLAAVARIFSPTRLHADVRIVWEMDGVQVRESRTVTIQSHRDGFRIWDALVFESGVVPPALYSVSLFAEGRPLGKAQVRVVEG